MIATVFFDIGNTLVADRQWLPGAKKLIHQLELQQLPVGLISNTGNLTRDQLASRLPEDFEFAAFREDLVFLSSETGVEKPKLSAFLLAVQHANVSPWQTMFIGESLTECLAAQTAGMQAARINDPETDFATLAEILGRP